MPYTPPAQSPGATPNSSRSSSFSNHDPRTRSTLNLLDSSNPPRSATYLHKHRRSSAGTLPPFQAPIPHSQQNYNSPPPKSDPRANASLHQSPPPVVDSRISVIPTGALMSPPDSTQNSSDEEGENTRRGRDLGRLEDELKEAIKKLPQRRLPSPDGNPVVVEQEVCDSQARKGHHRTRSDSAMLIDIAGRPRSSSNSSSISDGDEGYREAPAMVRKKSGEVVKSSLKSPGRSRPASVPSTPTFPPKNVHFDARIEHVRHFLHSEKPSAVSVGSSPVEGVYDGESEYPFGYDDEQPQWDIELPHFPKNHEARKNLPVRLEKVCLSNDKKNLIGTVAVANISFQKHVVARFTFDYWQTISEVTAEWTSDVRRREREDGVDRFVFKIKLTEQVNLAKKTLFFCVRYSAAGQEFWDNNGGVNFQVDFKKASRTTSNRPLPRSRPTGQRPRSMPTMELEGFLDQSFFRELGGHDDRFKKPRSKPASDEEDNVMPARRANPTGSTFSNRYDFRHSFNTTIKATSTANIPSKMPVLDVADTTMPMDGAYFSLNPRSSTISAELSMTTPLDSPSLTGAGPPEIFGTDNFWTIEDKPSIESPSYRELLDNYCFFGSSRATKPNSKPPPTNPSPEQKIKQSLEALLPTTEDGPSPPYTAMYKSSAQVPPPSLSIAQQKSAGNASPIPLNYAGYHHRRRGSGAFRFDTTATPPTAIC